MAAADDETDSRVNGKPLGDMQRERAGRKFARFDRIEDFDRRLASRAEEEPAGCAHVENVRA